MKTFTEWLTRKWSRKPDLQLAQSYLITFSTAHGRRVLEHLMNAVYCTIYEGSDPIKMAMHNGRRSLVHEILENIDLAEHPDKHEIETTTEEAAHG